MKRLFIILLVLGFANSANAADLYKIDPTHASINWTANHFGFSNQSGKITDVTGSISLDTINPKNSSVDVKIGTASLVTGLSKFDEHLKGSDFLDVAKFPTATFKSIEVIPAGKTAKIRGNLTLLGISKPITLDAKLIKIGLNPVSQRKTAGFFATTTLRRSDFGITFGAPGVSDSIKITIDLEASFVSSDDSQTPGAAPIMSGYAAKKTETTTSTIPEWKVAPTKSKIEFKATQDNSTLSGSFKKFEGIILFDRKQLSKSKINLSIDATSVEVSFAEATSALQSLAWLSTKAFPTATFSSDNITLLSDANVLFMDDVNSNIPNNPTNSTTGANIIINNPNRSIIFRATGKLTIRGKTIPTSVDFSITNHSKTEATATGKLTIKRSAFGIGDRDPKKANGVKDDIETTFTIIIER